MELVKTKDNSITFYNEEFSEHYHSVSGALEEAFEKFAKPAGLKDGMKVLDICFGMGYNSLAAISLANVEIVALENDKRVLEEIQKVKVPEGLEKNYGKIKSAAKNLNYEDEKTKIKLLIEDARESVKRFSKEFDVVFLDPFSTKKCPSLWTEGFFKNIRKAMKEKGVLNTYSCAGSVRKNLKAANFEVGDGPIVGRRSPSTTARAT